MTHSALSGKKRKRNLRNELKKLRPLIDLDSYIYGAGFAADVSVEKDLMETLGCDREKARELAREQEDYITHALGNLKQQIQQSLRLFSEDNPAIYLTGVGNYREEIATIAPYKGNRDSGHKPKYYKEMRRYAIDSWGAEVIDGMEADDAVSMEQWANPDKSTIIVSIDKDLLNTPGHHYNPRRDEYQLVTLAEADRNFWMQGGTGDTTDNIKGLKGVGPKTVWKEWEKNPDLEMFKDWLRRGYDKQYGADGEHAMWENLTLLWMQRELWINWDGGDIRGGNIGKEESHEESSEEGEQEQNAAI